MKYFYRVVFLIPMMIVTACAGACYSFGLEPDNVPWINNSGLWMAIKMGMREE